MNDLPLLQIDWPAVFVPEANLLEAVLRGTVVYFVLLVLLRIIPWRTVGSVGMMDLVVVVLVAEAAGKSMGEYTSVTDGIVIVLTLIGWSYVLNWITYKVPAIEKLVSPSALPVVRDGRLLRRNMRAEYLTEEELLGQMRLEGIEDPSQVKAAYVESEGTISFVKREQAQGA